MRSLGLIAGSGGLPAAIAREARGRGVERIVAVAFPGQTPADIGRAADEVHWVRVGQLGKLIRALRAAGVTEAVMAGRLEPRLVISELRLDLRMLALAARVADRRADTVLRAIAEEMERDGIRLLDSTLYLNALMAREGPMTRRRPGAAAAEDIRFGAGIAREVARLDIGQIVVVRKKAVVAVEAMEGTDETIRRAARLCPKGMVAVKVSRPRQDMRFDVPVVGGETIGLLAEARAAALALEAGRTIMLDREAFLRRADEARIAVVGI
ncbi:MAG: UDP-2,3-diacylglucosamine diphosphatase LpxI [bacterium]|nr:UDP-2,3-diacylglucosamine diphosphatase LpxI [bacterium]